MRRIINEPFRIQSKDGLVFGFYMPNRNVKILSGSFFRNIEVNSLRVNVRNERLYLINNGYVKDNKLIKDYTFNTPSLAISVLMGHMDTGNKAFYTNDNIELGTYLEVDINVDNKAKYKECLHFSKVRKLVEIDDECGVVSTADIDSEIILEPHYKPTKKPEKVKGTTISFKRDELVAKKGIILSNYKCNLNAGHESFITKNGKPYMEAHHLIPLNAQDKFENSLDVDANIVCLCSNCHKKLHYGMDINKELKYLYDLKIDFLKKSGLNISFEDLLELYE